MMVFDRNPRGLYWVAWVLFGLFMAVQDIVLWGPVPLTRSLVAKILILNLCQNLAWGVLSLGTLRVCRKYPLHHHPPGRHWAAHLFASVLIVSVGLSIILGIAFVLFPFKGPLLRAFQQEAAKLISFEYLVCYWGVVGLHEGFQILKQDREGALQYSIIESQLAEAELQAIKVQLNPHFLFNTLSALSALIHSDLPKADRMLVKLSRFLRISLERGVEECVGLGQEISLLDDYLDIERVRFGNRLKVILQVPDHLRDAQIPAFVLQPVVENSIKHGIAGREEGGSIVIRAFQEDHDLVIEIQDDGLGTAHPTHPAKSTGIGLSNTRRRLEKHFGDDQSFILTFPAEGGAVARITIPLRIQSSSSIFMMHSNQHDQWPS